MSPVQNVTHVDGELVTVWFEGGVPYGIVWNSRHYRVTDSPTQLDDARGIQPGWRFQATDDHELSLVFDIMGDDAGWRVAHVYA